jgi:hypothetical protein
LDLELFRQRFFVCIPKLFFNPLVRTHGFSATTRGRALAYGPIDQATVALAGFALANHYLAAITDDTNTRVLDVASAEMFGLGFLINR